MNRVFGSSFRANLKEYMEMAEKSPLVIERRTAENLVLMSEEEYNRLMRKESNEEILSLEMERKIDEAVAKRFIEYERLLRVKDNQ